VSVVDDLIGELKKIERDGERAVGKLKSADDLEALRVEYLGRKGGRLTAVLRRLGELGADERPAVGAEANRVKDALGALMDARAAALAPAGDAGPGLDLTLPGRHRWKGGLHPVTVVVDEICDIFRDLGFTRVAGPEVETVDYNFVKLNTPLDHPAADMHDTFYLDETTVLRTHTSPVQARSMLTRELPIYVICPGRTYRTDELDATHTPVFHQVEGLAVDKGLSMAHLKGTLDHFATAMFGDGITTRFRPSYFPFTEPSAEVDLICFVCRGVEPDVESCRTCRGEGWIEWGGCGVVNPRVLVAGGIDPEVYSGFAFGMGVERTLMFRHGVEDMRDMVEGDVRFTLPFGTEL